LVVVVEKKKEKIPSVDVWEGNRSVRFVAQATTNYTFQRRNRHCLKTKAKKQEGKMQKQGRNQQRAGRRD